jgi:hypothetical protein
LPQLDVLQFGDEERYHPEQIMAAGQCPISEGEIAALT